MGKINYFHKDSEADRNRENKMNSEDLQERKKAIQSWIRHTKLHNDELREMINYSEELIASYKKDITELYKEQE